MAVNLVTVTGSLETLSGATPMLGRMWFKLNRPDWNLTGDIFAPEYIEAIANPATGAFTVAMQSTTDFQTGATYSAILRYREPLDGKDREYTVGTFALAPGGPFELGDLLTVPIIAPVPADILALCQAYAASASTNAASSLANANAAAASAVTAAASADTAAASAATAAISAYTTTATAAGTTTLTAASLNTQFFTGVTTQTLVLPVASTLVLGRPFLVVNNSTGAIAVQSSGLNAIASVPSKTSMVFTCILVSGTTAASWDAKARGFDITPALMRAQIGLAIGADVQPFDADLAALAALATTGLISRTGAGAVAARTITAGVGIAVTNGDGVAGNPTVAALSGEAGPITASGTAIDFPSIPSYVNRVSLILGGLSLTGGDEVLIRLGNGGVIDSAGYVSAYGAIEATATATAGNTTGFLIGPGYAASSVSGIVFLEREVGTNLWVTSFSLHTNTSAPSRVIAGGGRKTLAGVLTNIRLLPGGANTFDAGTASIRYS